MKDVAPQKDDSARLRQAIRAVLDAARAKSLAVNKAVEDCFGESMREVHATHLDELNAIQALVGSLELFERRLENRPGAALSGPASV